MVPPVSLLAFFFGNLVKIVTIGRHFHEEVHKEATDMTKVLILFWFFGWCLGGFLFPFGDSEIEIEIEIEIKRL